MSSHRRRPPPSPPQQQQFPGRDSDSEGDVAAEPWYTLPENEPPETDMTVRDEYDDDDEDEEWVIPRHEQHPPLLEELSPNQYDRVFGVLAGSEIERVRTIAQFNVRVRQRGGRFNVERLIDYMVLAIRQEQWKVFRFLSVMFTREHTGNTEQVGANYFIQALRQASTSIEQNYGLLWIGLLAGVRTILDSYEPERTRQSIAIPLDAAQHRLLDRVIQYRQRQLSEMAARRIQ